MGDNVRMVAVPPDVEAVPPDVEAVYLLCEIRDGRLQD
jgi:hypothetical protein